MSEESLNEKWDMSRVIQNAIESAHNTPAPETRERLKALEVTQQNVMDKLEESIKDNKESHILMMSAIDKLDKKLDQALDKKADKESVDKIEVGKANLWVETAFTYMLYTVGGILLTSLIYLVIKK